MGMARALELNVVAEGVETDGQAVSLRALGCETAQGFHFARPKAAAEITELLVADRLRRRPEATGTERPPGAPGSHVLPREATPARFARSPE